MVLLVKLIAILFALGKKRLLECIFGEAAAKTCAFVGLTEAVAGSPSRASLRVPTMLHTGSFRYPADMRLEKHGT